MQKEMSPFVMVIFGATGDLTARKLLPALYKLYAEKNLPERFFIVGVARRELTEAEFRDQLLVQIKKHSRIGINEALWQQFCRNLYYQQGTFESKATYNSLVTLLRQFDAEIGACITRFFYLATPPSHYSSIIDNLHSSKLSEGCGQKSNKWTRILIEKPFGIDAPSSRSLEEKLAKIFEEKQIYRVDHYLGKEAIQNIIAFRFANGIFEPIWNKDYVDHVQITMAESGGVSSHANFYEGVGALRDVMQNHMLQMLALVAMEQPKNFSEQAVRDERCKAIIAIKLIHEGEVDKYAVRGQYGEPEGQSKSAAEKIRGYREEDKVDPNSNTETYVAMKLFLNNSRWQGIPWYLRTGKRLKKDAVEISLVFKQTCHILFREIGCPEEGNILTLRVSPNEGIGVRFIIKEPGHAFKLKDVDMNFHFKEIFSEEQTVEAYERILEEIFKGDQMLFNRSDEMAASWRLITPILNYWQKKPSLYLPIYPAGSWGPKAGDELLAKDGRKWILK